LGMRDGRGGRYEENGMDRREKGMESGVRE